MASDTTPEADVDWLAIFAAAEGDDPNSDWVRLTPEIVAIVSLRDCEEQLERCAEEPVRFALAAKSAHLSVQAALTAALAGSMNIGAYPEALRVKWLQYLQGESSERPEKTRVLAFSDLLKRALAAPLEWSGKPLKVTPDQQEMLDRLSGLRDDIEHVKTRHWSIEPAYIKQTIPVAVRLAVELLEIVYHHLEEGELEELRARVDRIAHHCQA